MRVYFPLLWLVLVGGLVPGLFFAVTFWPRRSRLHDAIDVAGLVVLVIVLYAWSALTIVLGTPRPTSTVSAVFGLVLGAAIDAALWVRAIRWWRLRHEFNQQKKKGTP